MKHARSTTPTMHPVRFLQLIALMTLGGVLAATGCSDATGPDPLPVLIDVLPRSLSQAELSLIEADNAFALKLFREIATQQAPDSNIFVSPLSIGMALGMAYNGAAGETQQAMAQALEVQDMNLDEVNQGYRDLIGLLFDLDPAIAWRLGNSIWYREGLAVEPAFLDVNQTFFDAQVRALDFASPDAAGVINQWVSDRTNGLIEEIVDDPIAGDLVMFLINAIYFKGDWRFQFDKSRTQGGVFTLVDGTEITPPTMWHADEVDLRFSEDDLVSAVEMPYGGGAFTMTVAVPHPDVSLQSVVEALDAARWASWTETLRAAPGLVVMPKFAFQYEIELKDVLTTLGMGVAFDGAGADFTGISTSDALFIDHVKHKTFIEVDEAGTEAVAATSVAFGERSAAPANVFFVDRPFLFAIRERLSGTIVFMGRMVDPTL